MFKAPSVAENAYSSPIRCPSLHFLGTISFAVPYFKTFNSFAALAHVNVMEFCHPMNYFLNCTARQLTCKLYCNIFFQ